MRSKIIWLGIGLGSLSLVLGLFIGASNSPVTGVMVSGLFGLLVAIAGIMYPKKEKDVKFELPAMNLNQVGKLLIVFSIFILLGAYLGMSYRNVNIKSTPTSFIWDKKQAPHTTYEALDWVTVTELLVQKGFTQEQIKSLYEIRLTELKDTCDPYKNNYSETRPYSKMLVNIASPEPKRGLASE